jgi:peptidyl-prolyl cis-trans isomerase D
MTMLDRMRRHRHWLKWSLGLVCLAFVIFYIPEFLPRSGLGSTARAAGTVAIVEGKEIRADDFRRTYQSQLQAYRAAYGANMNERLLKQLGVDRQILQQMIDDEAALTEAKRLSVRVSDQEVAHRIAQMPAFQENGVFIGEARYRQLLQSQRPPLSPGSFEDNVRKALVVEKLRAQLTSWMSIGDAELEREYRRRNEMVKLAVVTVTPDSLRAGVNVPDADVATYFESHQEDFRVPEKRKIKYLLIDVDALRAKTVVPEADIERAYNDNIAQYSTPEQVHASHILLKTDGRDEKEVKSRAEEVLKEAKSGADFAALAKKYSQDEATAKNGGDLDFFGRGRMVPEFDTAVFAMQPGQISDLIKTQYGFHIIKLIDKKAGTTQPLSEVRTGLQEQLAMERAQTEAAAQAARLAGLIKKPADLESVAASNGLQVQESGMFAQTEPILGLGASPAVSARAFELTDGQVSEQLQTGRGFVFMTVSGKQASYLPKLDEVKERVRDVVAGQRARDLAKQKAAELAPKLKAGDFDKVAKAAGIEPKTTEMLTRDGSLPDLGQVPAVMDAAFALPKGAVSDPISNDRGTVIVKVLEKQEVSADDFGNRKDAFREEVMSDRRNRFFAAYMAKVKQRMRIDINPEAIQRAVS